MGVSAILIGLVSISIGSPAEMKWERMDYPNGISTAQVVNARDAVAAIRCREGQINPFFQIPSNRLDPALKAGQGVVEMTLFVDDGPDMLWAEALLFESMEGQIATQFIGGNAELWALNLAAARFHIEMSFALDSATASDEEYREYNIEVFPTTGAHAAIMDLLAQCGE